MSSRMRHTYPHTYPHRTHTRRPQHAGTRHAGHRPRRSAHAQSSACTGRLSYGSSTKVIPAIRTPRGLSRLAGIPTSMPPALSNAPEPLHIVFCQTLRCGSRLLASASLPPACGTHSCGPWQCSRVYPKLHAPCAAAPSSPHHKGYPTAPLARETCGPQSGHQTCARHASACTSGSSNTDQFCHCYVSSAHRKRTSLPMPARPGCRKVTSC